MALAPMNVENVLGEFTEKEFGNYFHYSENPDRKEGCEEWCCYPHLVWVGGLDFQYRYAKVKKTVAYVVTDENDDGSPVIEKWFLKKNVEFVV